jgi:hypothetical protein
MALMPVIAMLMVVMTIMLVVGVVAVLLGFVAAVSRVDVSVIGMHAMIVLRLIGVAVHAASRNPKRHWEQQEKGLHRGPPDYCGSFILV